MSSSKESKQNDLLTLGKKLQQFYNLGYVNKKQTILFSFYKGIASGFGAILGGTIVIGLVLWILSLFSEIPIAGRFIEVLNKSLQNK